MGELQHLSDNASKSLQNLILGQTIGIILFSIVPEPIILVVNLIKDLDTFVAKGQQVVVVVVNFFLINSKFHRLIIYKSFWTEDIITNVSVGISRVLKK